MPSVNGMKSVSDMTPVTAYAEAPLARGSVVRKLRQLGIDTQYALLGFPLSIITIVVCMTGISLGLGLIVIWVGLPIMMATLLFSRGFATVERARIGPVLGRKV